MKENKITIRIIDKTHKADINIKNHPFKLFGLMLPSYNNGKWDHTELVLPPENHTQMCFPDENYNYDPDYHRQGIGSALVSAALEALRSLGIPMVALVVFERNQDGNAFWEKQGFTVRTDLTYRNKVLMETVRKDT